MSSADEFVIVFGENAGELTPVDRKFGEWNAGLYCIEADCRQFISVHVEPNAKNPPNILFQGDPPKRLIPLVCPHCRAQQQRAAESIEWVRLVGKTKKGPTAH